MAENLLPPHTDSIPHFKGFQYPIFYLHETALPHAIATNAIADEMTLLHLEDECRVEHLPSIGVTTGGDITPTPFFSDEWVAYGQTRGFERYNIKTHEYKSVIIGSDLDEFVKASRVIDADRNLFAFMVENLGDDDSSTRYFRTYDLSEKKPKLLCEIEAGRYKYDDRGSRFVSIDSTLFYLHETERKLVALDYNLQPKNHPFADAYNEHCKTLIKTSKINAHPELPFALVVSKITGIVSWKDGAKDFTPFPFIEKDRYVTDFSFSQDGKYIAWCSFSKKYPVEGPPVYWYAKVSDKIPGYIGMPKKLGPTFSKMPEDRRCTAWARNPTTYIVSEMEGLFWWHIE